jgi:hypothetical protein
VFYLDQTVNRRKDYEMSTILLLGFEEREVVSGDLQVLQEKFGQDGPLTLKPIYPKTQVEHTALCSEPSVVAVLLLEHRFYIIPNAAARIAAPHILFSTKSGERMAYRALSIDISLSKLIIKQHQVG